LESVHVTGVNLSTSQTPLNEEQESLEVNVDRFWDFETLGISEEEFSNCLHKKFHLCE